MADNKLPPLEFDDEQPAALPKLEFDDEPAAALPKLDLDDEKILPAVAPADAPKEASTNPIMAGVRAAAQSGSAGLADELYGVVGAIANPTNSDKSFNERRVESRDFARKADKLDRKEHPTATGIGDVAGEVMLYAGPGKALAPKGGPLTKELFAENALKMGQMGAIKGFGKSDAELGPGDVVKDMLKGAGTEALLSAPATVAGRGIEKGLEKGARGWAKLFGRGDDVSLPYLADPKKYNDPELSIENAAKPAREQFAKIEQALSEATEKGAAAKAAAKEAKDEFVGSLDRASLDDGVVAKFRQAADSEITPLETAKAAAKNDLSSSNEMADAAKKAYLQSLKDTKVPEEAAGLTKEALKELRGRNAGMSSEQVQMLKDSGDTKVDLGEFLKKAKAQRKALTADGTALPGDPDVREVGKAGARINNVIKKRANELLKERFPEVESLDELPTSELKAIMSEARQQSPEVLLGLRQRFDKQLSGAYKRGMADGGYSDKGERAIKSLRDDTNTWLDTNMPNSEEAKALRNRLAEGTRTEIDARKAFGGKGVMKKLERLAASGDPEAMAILEKIDTTGKIREALAPVTKARQTLRNPAARDAEIAALPEVQAISDKEAALSNAGAALEEKLPLEGLRGERAQSRLQSLNNPTNTDEAVRAFELAGRKAEGARAAAGDEFASTEMGQAWDSTEDYLKQKLLRGDKGRLADEVAKLPEVARAQEADAAIEALKAEKAGLGSFTDKNAEAMIQRLMKAGKPGAAPDTALKEEAARVGKQTGQDLVQTAEDLRIKNAFDGGAPNGSRLTNIFGGLGRVAGSALGAPNAGAAAGRVTGGLLDYGTGKAAKMGLDRYLAEKGPAVAATSGLISGLGEKIMGLAAQPEGKKYAELLDKAAERGPEAVIATHAALMKDPAYKAMMEADDLNVTPPEVVSGAH